MKWITLLLTIVSVAGCGGSASDIASDRADGSDAGAVMEGLPTCESVLSADPADAANCAYEADPSAIKLVGITETAECSYVVFDRSEADGTWFGIFGGDWIELEPDEFTQDRISAECNA